MRTHTLEEWQDFLTKLGVPHKLQSRIAEFVEGTNVASAGAYFGAAVSARPVIARRRVNRGNRRASKGYTATDARAAALEQTRLEAWLEVDGAESTHDQEQADAWLAELDAEAETGGIA